MRPDFEIISASTHSVPSNYGTESTPVLVLKELVATLHREQNKIQNLLSSLGFALRSFNNLNQFLELTPLMASRVTDADGSALMLINAKGLIVLEQLHCQDPQTTPAPQPIIEDLIRHLNDLPTEERSLALLDGEIRQALGAHFRLYNTPILVKNQERGRLYVFSQDQEYIWTQTRRRLLQLVADQTSVAIANSELTVELRAKERQDRELEIASEIQLRLLPRKCPFIEGVQLAAKCHNANRVGGDYYDFIPTNYDQLTEKGEQGGVPWSIVIGDVMGKGVPAGLIMTMTRGMLRAEVLNRHSPAEILQHLNRVMYADLENSRRFVTLFYSEYDPTTRCLFYSNAAHNPPLLWKRESHSMERIDTVGMLIGLYPDSDYENGQIQLDIGDTILYYTDGMTDAVSPNGDRFDEDNLLKAFKWACEKGLEPQGILDYLFEKIQRFVGDSNAASDDMTLVVMQLK